MATSQPLQLYPAWLNLKGQKVLLAGGGQVALRRATTLLSHRARLRVAAPEVLPLFERWEAEKRIQLFRRVFKESDLDGARLAFACTDDPQVNQQIVNSALSMGIWVESCTRAEGAN
ncbi:MAG: NAD(P)-dependent oxidoreductase, partial [Candidatus Omnitrophica bacterium]|nr:NAD(P)-dependent oxidoreductase [Candidatus Omnitrophota bacterium]